MEEYRPVPHESAYWQSLQESINLPEAGLPCPNLGIGGWAYHGPYEHITAEAMDQVSNILRELILRFSLPEETC